MLRLLDVLKPLLHTIQTWGFSPVCVLIWRFNNEGLSNAFPQTSQGNNARSDFAGLLWIFGVISSSSFDDPADDEVSESPDTDLCSSSAPEGGDIGKRTLDRRDVDKSNGESSKIESIVCL